jgi:hypothetical protein
MALVVRHVWKFFTATGTADELFGFTSLRLVSWSSGNRSGRFNLFEDRLR